MPRYQFKETTADGTDWFEDLTSADHCSYTAKELLALRAEHLDSDRQDDIDLVAEIDLILPSV